MHMPTRINQLLLVLLALLVSPAWAATEGAIEYKSEVAEGVDFMAIKTYAWIEYIPSDSATKDTPEYVAFIIEHVDIELENFGWRRVADEAESPDVFMLVMGGLSDQPPIWVREVDVRGDTITVNRMSSMNIRKKFGNLQIYVVDAESKDSIWQGFANSPFRISKDSNLANIGKAIVALFNDFPNAVD